VPLIIFGHFSHAIPQTPILKSNLPHKKKNILSNIHNPTKFCGLWNFICPRLLIVFCSEGHSYELSFIANLRQNNKQERCGEGS
jgi:hypothetical protein